jgi:Mg-chelatase subunit ChlD
LNRKRDDADCSEPAIRARLEVFHENKDKVLKFFKGKTQTIDGTQSIEDVFTHFKTAISNPIPAVAPTEDDGGWAEADEQAAKAAQEASLDVKLSVAPAEFVPLGGARTPVAITISPPNLVDRVPVDVCCVIDISGSMDSEAMFQDPDDDTKQINSGFSQLDIVKHAVKAITNTLTERDRLSLVVFDSNAEISFPLTVMNPDGIAAAIAVLEKLYTKGSTNIWAGLETALTSLRTASHQDSSGTIRQCSVCLLTDGVPDASDITEQEHLRRYKANYPDFICQVNTFGFGYNLQSLMLSAVSELGNGTFGFIPDAKIVGTCFVNTIANSASTLSQNCSVNVTLKNGAVFPFDFPGRVDAKHANIFLGPIQYGQPRDCVVVVDIPAGLESDEYMDVTATYTSIRGQRLSLSSACSARLPTPEARIAQIRTHALKVITNVIDKCASRDHVEGRKQMKDLVETIENYVVGVEDEDPRMKALKEDICGRVSKAVSTDERFKRWGQHYLRAIVRAHHLQLRTNFMDPGLQVYGGELFNKLQHRGGEIFVSLPMVSTRGQAPPVDNTVYYGGGGGGCFDSSCTVVVLKEGEEMEVKMKEVKKNDFVKVVEDGEQAWARVECVVEIERNGELVEFPKTGLKITSKHPIRISGDWAHPIDFIETGDAKIAKGSGNVYNFVLDGSHSLLVNDVECLTFGHGLNSEKTWDPFYASSRVLEVLGNLSGYEEGFVSVKGSLKNLEVTRKYF